MHHQFQSQNKLFKRSRASILRTQNYRLLCKSQYQPYSCLKLLSMSLLHSEKMPRLSEPGPPGMREKHWYDFGSHGGRQRLVCPSNCAHSSSCCSQPSATIPESWTDHTACQTHRRPQTTSDDVISSADLRSNQKWQQRMNQWPTMRDHLQYGVGRPDGANTMIKTIQYLAEAENSRVLVALDLKAAFQNVSRRAMLYSVAQTDADLAATFSKWYTGTTEHRMHYDSANTKISANSGVDQGCPLSACGFSAVVDPVLRSVHGGTLPTLRFGC